MSSFLLFYFRRKRKVFTFNILSSPMRDSEPLILNTNQYILEFLRDTDSGVRNSQRWKESCNRYLYHVYNQSKRRHNNI